MSAPLIRPETQADHAAIFDLTARAFAGKPYSDGSEPALVDALRQAGALSLSLVAEKSGQILGHVAFSAAVGEPGWFALGPISVDPAHQRQGIGGALIRFGLAALPTGAKGCVLIGDTNYYPRHGFIPRPDLCPPGEPAAHYMIHAFGPAPTAPLGFHPIFHSLAAP